MGKSKRRRPKQRLRLVHIMIFMIAALLNGVLCANLWTHRDNSVSRDNVSCADETVLFLQMSQAELHRGNLVLVNHAYSYNPETADDLVSISAGMNDAYFVKSLDLMLHKQAAAALNLWMRDYYAETSQGNINIVAGYRTIADQQSLYNNAVALHGEDYAADYFNDPGHSEHHTGLAVDFGTWSPATQTAGDFTGTGAQAWVLENAWRYGYIQRYPSEKQQITGIAYESWHFRYVGVPHAWYMYQHDLVLEEYLSLLTRYSFEAPLCFAVDGDSYQVYYCKGLSVPLPTAKEYEISGNNIDGFIVTVVV